MIKPSTEIKKKEIPCIVNTETLFNTNVLHRNNPLEKSVCDG